mgnify:FL=1
MTRSQNKAHQKKVRAIKIQLWMVTRASRNKTILDRFLRRFLEKAMTIDPQNDFMKDAIIDEDEGYDPDELDRYQRGE